MAVDSSGLNVVTSAFKHPTQCWIDSHLQIISSKTSLFSWPGEDSVFLVRKYLVRTLLIDFNWLNQDQLWKILEMRCDSSSVKWRWRWWWWRRRSDVNLKRSDEDKAWERGAVVVSESVFGSSDHFVPEQIWGTGKRDRGTFLLRAYDTKYQRNRGT